MPAARPLTLVAVLGSVTPPGRLHTALSGALARVIRRHAVKSRLVDLAGTRIAFADGRPPPELGDDTADTIAAVADADAVLLATPVYRGSITGVLKNLLDHVPVSALRDKPVGVLSMGASEHHYLGAERHLRDVLTFFGALTAPTAVYLTSADFDDNVPSTAAQTRIDELLDTTLMLAAATGGAALGPPPLAGGRA